MELLQKRLKKILLVDDDEGDIKIFKDILAEIDSSLQFYCSTDCDEILTILSNCLPDLVFLDISFPSANGFDCLQEIKLNSAHCHTPVVMYSISSYQGDIEAAYRNGAALYCKKFFSIDDLKKIISIILKLEWNCPETITKQYAGNGKYMAVN